MTSVKKKEKAKTVKYLIFYKNIQRDLLVSEREREGKIKNSSDDSKKK